MLLIICKLVCEHIILQNIICTRLNCNCFVSYKYLCISTKFFEVKYYVILKELFIVGILNNSIKEYWTALAMCSLLLNITQQWNIIIHTIPAIQSLNRCLPKFGIHKFGICTPTDSIWDTLTNSTSPEWNKLRNIEQAQASGSNQIQLLARNYICKSNRPRLMLQNILPEEQKKCQHLFIQHQNETQSISLACFKTDKWFAYVTSGSLNLLWCLK